MGSIVVDCENEHILHSNCFEDKATDPNKCPVCDAPMMFEDDLEEISNRNSTVYSNLSPNRNKKMKSKPSVTFADLPTEPNSRTRNDVVSSFPS